MEVINFFVMSNTASSTVKDRELIPSGLYESASVTSVADLIPTELNESELIDKNENNDFINIFICHMLFYLILCITLVLHIFIDLGLGSFVKRITRKLIDNAKNNPVNKNPVFA